MRDGLASRLFRFEWRTSSNSPSLRHESERLYNETIGLPYLVHYQNFFTQKLSWNNMYSGISFFEPTLSCPIATYFLTLPSTGSELTAPKYYAT